MTIAIGINFGDYALIAADTRTTNYAWGGRVVSYEDESKKIQETTMGLITGAGSKPLLDSVKNRLKNEGVNHTDQILAIIKQERLKYQRIYRRTAEQDIKITGWIFTYRTVEDKHLKLRLGMFHPSVGDVLAVYKENQPAVICPSEANEDVANMIGDFLKKKIKPFKEFGELSGSIQYHWSIIATLIQKIQPLFQSISPYSQVGVHTIDGLIGISPILKDTEPKVSITLRRS